MGTPSKPLCGSIIAKWIEEGDPDATLNLSDMNLTKLPPLPPTVRVLNCRNNSLKELTDLPPSLVILYCNGNQIEQRPVLPRGLAIIDCDNVGEWMRGYYSDVMWCFR